MLKLSSFFEDTKLWGDERCRKLFGRYDCEDNTINVSNFQGSLIVDSLLVTIGKVFVAPGCVTVSSEDLFSSWGLFLRMLYSNRELVKKTTSQFFKYVLTDFFTDIENENDDIEKNAMALTKVLLDHVRKQICTSVILDGHVYFNDSSLRR